MKGVLIMAVVCCIVGKVFAFRTTSSVSPGDSLLRLQVPLHDSLFIIHSPAPTNDDQADSLIYKSRFQKIDPATTHVVFLPDSLIRDTLMYEFTKIKKLAYKTPWMKELYGMVFVNPRPGRLSVMRVQNSEDRFEIFAGKTIRDINIKVLPPYGASVYDTLYQEKDLEKYKSIANIIHMRTSERIIRKQITLKPGMPVNPFELVQNEILLRQLDYIDDAVITPVGLEHDSTMVDLLLVCKDEFSWGGEIETNFLNAFSMEVENKNFLTLGHVVRYRFGYKGTQEKEWGNRLEYKINSLWGTHVDFRGYYRNDYLEKLVTLEISRQFLTTKTKWAGGISGARVYYSDALPDPRKIRLVDTLFDYRSGDIWMGRSFILDSRHSYNRNFYLTGRFYATTFDNCPVVLPHTNQLYYDRLNFLMAFTYVKIKYYKANLIYDFGRTEDVPTGLYASIITGFEQNDFRNSGYVGLEYRYSHFSKYTERFYAVQTAVGSYINDNGLEQGFVKLNANHISNLISVGKCKLRYYNNINYLAGVRRYEADDLYMQDYNIRGFDSDSLKGIQKLSGSVSATLFLPFIRKGCRMSVSGFMEAGVIAPEKQSLFESKAYLGLGMELNLRNDNVIFKNVSFRLAFYPRVPADVRSVQAVLFGGPKSKFYDYRVSKPQLVPYE